MISFVSKLRFPEERGVAAADMAVCRSFVEIGQDMELLVPSRRPKIKTDIWEFYQFKQNLFPIIKLFTLELPLSHLYFSVMSWTFSLATLWYLFSNRRNYVHLFNECRELGILLRLFSFVYKPWVVYEVHDLPTMNYELFLDRLLKPDLVLATTKRFADYYASIKTLVFPNGVFLEDFDYKTTKSKIREKLKLPKNRVIVGYAGRFLTDGQEKGIPELIQAVNKLKNVFLVCIGGPVTQILKYKELLKTEGLFLDYVPVKTLYLYMRAFDICAMPFPWTEHFAYRMSPLKMFEYMASKNPIVATDLPVVKEILKGGINCVLAKPNDADDLARKIESLIINKRLAKSIANNAFNEVKSKYLWTKRAENEINCYSADKERHFND